MFLCPFGQQLSLKPALPVKNQRTIFRCKSHKTLKKKLLVKILVQNLQVLHKNLSDRQISITSLSASRSDLGPLSLDEGYHN